MIRCLGACAGLAAVLTGCGGGGSRSSGSDAFVLRDIQYGRRVNGPGGPEVVSPFTTQEWDSLTGGPRPDSLAPLSPDVSLDHLVSIGLGPRFQPPVIPRDATLVLRFSAPVDPDSVVLDEVSAGGAVVQAGTVGVRLHDGEGVPLRAQVHGSQIWISAARDTGFPASPLSFGGQGEALVDPTGVLRLALTGLRSRAGAPLEARADGWGSPGQPIGLNPGNRSLDFVEQQRQSFVEDHLIPENEPVVPSNGYLPGRRAPRIAREVRFEAAFQGNFWAGPTSVGSPDVQFHEAAHAGNGEWSGGMLILRPGAPSEEQHRILRNSAHAVELATAFQVPPASGDALVLRRLEWFEPDPLDPVDPADFDPDGPELFRNVALLNFVQVLEIDAGGVPFGDLLTLRQPVPAFSELRVRFSEPMDPDSFGQWETFRVARNPDPGPGDELVTRLLWNRDHTEVRIQPAREDPVTGEVSVVGWGPGTQSLQLILSTVPRAADLVRRGVDVPAFLAQGARGVTGRSGTPLGFPLSAVDPADPVVRYREPFLSDASVSGRTPPPIVEDWGVLVHRFQGVPQAGVDPDTAREAARFADVASLYWPLGDVNLGVNGVLSGPPVAQVSRILDDFHPPPDGQFALVASGAGTPLTTPFGKNQAPPYEHNGVRFQHLFRDADASPGGSLAGTLLDLWRVSFAPSGGNVTADVYENVSVRAAHSPIRPITALNSRNSPLRKESGLNTPFDFDTYWDMAVLGIDACQINLIPEGPNYYGGSLTTTVPAGTRWVVTPDKLFRPHGTPHSYHPWPEFEVTFPYNNGDIPVEHVAQRDLLNDLAEARTGQRPWKETRRLTDNVDNRGGDSLLLEYRVQPQGTAVSYRNSFAYAWGMLNWPDPNFRAFSAGTRGQPLFPDGQDVAQLCATSSINTLSPADNCRYFAVFDYVKKTARVYSPYLLAVVGNAVSVEYHAPLVEPPADRQPRGTRVELLFSGSNQINGKNITPFSEDPGVASGLSAIAFRAQLESNLESQQGPVLDLVAIPYRRVHE